MIQPPRGAGEVYPGMDTILAIIDRVLDFIWRVFKLRDEDGTSG